MEKLHLYYLSPKFLGTNPELPTVLIQDQNTEGHIGEDEPIICSAGLYGCLQLLHPADSFAESYEDEKYFHLYEVNVDLEDVVEVDKLFGLFALAKPLKFTLVSQCTLTIADMLMNPYDRFNFRLSQEEEVPKKSVARAVYGNERSFSFIDVTLDASRIGMALLKNNEL